MIEFKKLDDITLVLKWEEGLHEEKETPVEKSDRVETIVTKDYKNNLQTTEIKIRCTPCSIDCWSTDNDKC